MDQDSKYDYNRFGSKGKRVGQAVMDIISKEQSNLTVEDILDDLGKDYLDLIRDKAETSKNIYQSPYYILSLLKKDLGYLGVANVIKHSARPFQLKPMIKKVFEAHPGAVKTLFQVDSVKGEINLIWCIPAYDDCISILKTPKSYDEQLVRWIQEAFQGSLDNNNPEEFKMIA